MQLTARASNTVRNKNLLLILMCAGFLGWFSYDGYVRWPEQNDVLVQKMKAMLEDGRLDMKCRPALEAWKGWNNETSESQKAMTDISLQPRSGKVEGWHTPLDMVLQRIYIPLGLLGATMTGVWWFIRCQKRRVIADETTVSPAEGVVIPWEKITVVDNTRWKKSGIVDITYVDDAGHAMQAKFDDYETEREPLLEILDLMAEKAQRAEFIPKSEPAEPTTSG